MRAENVENRTKRSEQIVGLDLVRFFAAIYVVFHHLGWVAWKANKALPLSYTYFEPYAWPGFIGVEVFFVLSGFVIAYSASRATAFSFAENRAIRLYPAAWICASVTVLVAMATQHRDMVGTGTVPLWFQWLRAVSLWPLGPWPDGSFWTLGVEAGFYVQVFTLLGLRRFRWLGAWMATIGGISSLSLAITALCLTRGTTHAWLAHFAAGVATNQKYFVLLLHHGCFFTIGVFLWLLMMNRFTWERLAILVAMFPGAFLDIRLRVGWYGDWKRPLLIWLAALIAIVLAVLYNNEISRWLGTRGEAWCRRLGAITYPLYLVHAAAGCILLKVLYGKLPDLLNFGVVVTGMVGLACLINIYGEVPLQRMLRRHLHPARDKAPAVTVP